MAPPLLLAATAATTLFAGAGLVALPDRAGPAEVALAGLPYAAAILGILAAHELGHALLSRAWGVDCTLPHFVPGPPPVGTLGAVIRIRSALPSRRAVLDIGAAGPLAGFAVALPLLAWGLSRSTLHPLGDAWLQADGLRSPWQALQAWLAGAGGAELLARTLGPGTGALRYGDSLLTWAVQRAVLGPVPPGHDVLVHPVARAAWFGLFVTALNLIPLGQLDGGHVLYAWLGGRRARQVSRLVSWGLFAAGLLLSWSWIAWWAITRFVVRTGHPPALDEAPLDRARVAVALLSLLLFAATFVPVPVSA